jgi:hypothetical protein
MPAAVEHDEPDSENDETAELRKHISAGEAAKASLMQAAALKAAMSTKNKPDAPSQAALEKAAAESRAK